MGFVEINKNIAQLKSRVILQMSVWWWGGGGVRAPHHTNVYKILRLCGEISLPPFGRITFKLGK